MAGPAKTAATGGKKKKGGGKLKLYTFLLCAMFAAPFMLPTVLLLIAGLIPTFVALVVDKDAEHSYATSIGAMNFAGITPFLIDLWMKGQTIGNAMMILTNPQNWLIILGSAAVGQAIVFVVPQAIATLTLVHSEMRIKHLKGNLQILNESWGPDVGTTKPMNSMVRSD